MLLLSRSSAKNKALSILSKNLYGRKFKKLIGMDNSVSSINKTHETTLWYHRHFAKFSHQNISNVVFWNFIFQKKGSLKLKF